MEGAEGMVWPCPTQLESDPLRAHPWHPDLSVLSTCWVHPDWGTDSFCHPYLGRIRLCDSQL